MEPCLRRRGGIGHSKGHKNLEEGKSHGDHSVNRQLTASSLYQVRGPLESQAHQTRGSGSQGQRQQLRNPDIVLVHYLNVPAIEDCGKPCGPILCSINTDKKEWAKWTKEELIGQLKPMCEYLPGPRPCFQMGSYF
ncbi:hypothetical protein ACRRTK_016196 [Alexandromys fortis]